MVEWETGEITSEPLTIVATDDPVTGAIYKGQRTSLETEGWKLFKSIAKCEKKFLCEVHESTEVQVHL